MNRNDMRYRMKIRRGMQAQDTIAQAKHAQTQQDLLAVADRGYIQTARFNANVLAEAREQSKQLGRVADVLEAILAIAKAEHEPRTELVSGIEAGYLTPEDIRALQELASKFPKEQ